MIKDERVLELIEIIKKKKRIAVKELAEITFSSTSTLRRDLIFLDPNHSYLSQLDVTYKTP
ncbi:DeoR family transcriptional regulator, partial [Streptococcus pneumoniae]|uniref:DeoR family transcriptional regulator n=1 Tax=Streptococcus pneumoniae TaxID=1313 RepID=UPI0012942BF7